MQDVFLNIAGGIKVEDPAIDLAVCASLISSLEEIPLSSKICFAAEVGLGGELRAVNRIESRIMEAQKLGFKEIYISWHNAKNLEDKKFDIVIQPFKQLKDMFGELMG
jgi:DNA repair protein RadA/Sms